MSKLINANGEVLTNDWRVFNSENIEHQQDLDDGYWLLSTESFLNLVETPTYSSKRFAVVLSADDTLDGIDKHIGQLPLIACQFAAFMDGRSFSQARLLRERYDFSGELRATGEFIQDQLFYMRRCGFSTFEVDDNADIKSIKQSLNDFSESYQAACDEPQPLFRRRIYG